MNYRSRLMCVCGTESQQQSVREREKDWKRDAIWLPDLVAICSQPHSRSWVGKHSSRCRRSYRLSLRQSTNASRPSPVNCVCVFFLSMGADKVAKRHRHKVTRETEAADVRRQSKICSSFQLAGSAKLWRILNMAKVNSHTYTHTLQLNIDAMSC